MSVSTSLPTQLLQEGDLFSRRLLLLHTSLYKPTGDNPPESSMVAGEDKGNSFDTNVVMVLSVLLCALIFSLGLNSVIRCALKCSRSVDFSGNEQPEHRRKTSTGVNRKAVQAFTVVKYSPELQLPGLDGECMICLADFSAGEKLRLLPKCNHGFHIKCIDKWLVSHSTCPKCRQCLVESCDKIAGGFQPPVNSPVTVVSEETVVNIAPLDPEGPVRHSR